MPLSASSRTGMIIFPSIYITWEVQSSTAFNKCDISSEYHINKTTVYKYSDVFQYATRLLHLYSFTETCFFGILSKISRANRIVNLCHPNTPSNFDYQPK